MYSSVALSVFMLSCKHHHHPSAELFSSSQTETLYPLNSNSHPPFPAPGNIPKRSESSDSNICMPMNIVALCTVAKRWR